MQIKELEIEVTRYKGLKEMLDVFDEASKEDVMDIVNLGYENKKLVGATLDDGISKNYATWKVSTAQKKKLIDPIDEVIDFGKKQLANYSIKKEQEIMVKQAEAKKEMENSGVDPALVPEPEKPKAVVEGFSKVTNYSFEITDEAKIPREFMTPDIKKIGGVARAMKDTMNIPGVKLVKTSTMKRKSDKWG